MNETINPSLNTGQEKINWLDKDKIDELLTANNLAEYNLIILQETPSTNTYVLNDINKFKDKTVVMAEYQSCGRGRGNKVWLSKLAVDITVSFVYWLDLEVKYEVLPLVVAVAVNRLLKDCKIKTKIKWPNDIHLENGEKICGILVESGINQGKRFVVIGIGLDNVNNLERNYLLFSLIKNLDNVMSEFLVFGFSLIKQEWLDNCVHHKHQVSVLRNNEILSSGINVGISDSGALLVESDNHITEYNSANISLRF